MINYSDFPLPLAEHQYAVIDRIRQPELPDTCQGAETELVSPMLAPQARLYPWLIPLNALPRGEWKALISKLSQHSAADSPPDCTLLLSSPHPPQVVRSALIRAMHFKDPQRQGYILRYYDPRVLFHLHWMLSPWQLFNQLSGREIPGWTFWLEGEWRTLKFPGCVSWQPGDSAEVPLEQLQRCGMINRILQALPPDTDMAHRQEISRKADTLLEQALKCGLPGKEDCMAFALHGLTQPEGFWMAPKMAALLAQARQTANLYCDETRSWDENRWREMTRTPAYNNGWNK